MISILIILVSLSGCKKQEAGDSLRKVRLVLDWTPNTNHAGIYVARDLGYFKEQGLDVEIIQPGENTAEKIVAAGQAEFGISYQESVTIARSQSIPVKSIAAVIQHNTSGFASLKKDNITSPKDFAGKKYGSSGWPSELEILRQVTESAGADYGSVEIVSGVYDFFSTIGKDVDFEWIFYGWDGVQAKLKGIDINYIPAREIDPIFDFYTPVIITNDLLVNSDPELMKSFLKATTQGYRYCMNDPTKASEILSKAVPELDKAQVAAGLEYLKDEFQSGAPKWGMQDATVWQRFSDWMFQKRIIRVGVKASEAFTNEYLP
jgi:ABC-type nitrate/sulfonate/bicarbonate transport system substrate-binding protein